jgi:eukaryotic-like serine/threonine-protein kinase
MAKLFTITQGLENMGALKMGGQGSVYKGKRSNGVITAIKLLPTPIFSESEEDKNYRDFRNEVEKLKRVNQVSNPNVVRILSSGITDTGNFPFIEMEFIEGPDLEELLKPPHDPLFTVAESIKVADHLSNAIAHCHRVEVKHGDIKSNNVKYNLRTSNYMLLDFGLAIMSDEQRRTSLRHAGAIEFMAPEQIEGKMYYETDVYSFGVVIYELLAGRVPFPLSDKSERARNAIMVAHMETPPPDMMALRKQHLPSNWNEDKKAAEMNVPSWVLKMLAKCLAKDPAQRFKSGIELHDFILQHQSGSVLVPPQVITTVADPKIEKENQELRQMVAKQRQEITELRTELDERGTELYNLRYSVQNQPRKGFSSGAFYTLLLITALLAAFAAYSVYNNINSFRSRSETFTAREPDTTSLPAETVPETKKVEPERRAPDTATTVITEPDPPKPKTTDPMVFDTSSNNTADQTAATHTKYTVKSKAFFHNQPDESTRREAFIVHWNNAILEALDEKNGFIYVVYTNEAGQTSRGWIKKSDLDPVEE